MIPSRFHSLSQLLICLLIGTLSLALAGCEDTPSTEPKSKNRDSALPLNVVLITLDTLRADHLGCYGAGNVRTPNIDRLAAQGTLFLNATAQAPLTLPSHASLFTGSYPPTHGVRDNLGFVLPETQLTLAEILQSHGWRTAGFVSAYVLSAQFGVAQGFDTFSDKIDITNAIAISPDSIQRDGAETVEEALEWIKANRGTRFFTWIHLFDPHAPYDPPAPYAKQYLFDPYAGEVAYTDSLVGRLNEGLSKIGLMENTLLMVAGDHGEGKGEHQERYHGVFVYDSTLQVPFIIRMPGLSPQVCKAQVRLIDALPTLLDLLGIEIPGDIFGRSLKPLMTGEKSDLKLAAYSESWFPKLHYGWSALKSLRAGKYKYIHAPCPELYDLEADPMESTNLALSIPERAAGMKKALEAIEVRTLNAATHEAARTGSQDAQTLEALRLLGYTGTTVPAAAKGDEALADPKEKIGLLVDVSAAERLISSGAPHRAIPILEAVVAQEPQMLDALISLGIAHLKAESFTRAVEVFQETTHLAPDLFMGWANLSLALKECGRLKEALTAARKAVELNPKSRDVRKILDGLK